MFEWVRKLFGAKPAEKPVPPAPRAIKGRYDAAQTTNENSPLWVLTDYLSARAANNYAERRTLRIRARYEYVNNSYCAGIVITLANDLIGMGPRLQSHAKDPALNKAVEKQWHDWAKARHLAEKLRTMTQAKKVDGETLGLLTTNKSLPKDGIQLDLSVIETDQCSTPDPGFLDSYWVDGMVLDAQGNVSEYHILRQHPGDLYFAQLNPLQFDKWKPKDVCHWFRKKRPGEVRAVSELTPGLELFAQLRRYSKAVMAAAEASADMAILLTTDMPANYDDDQADGSAGGQSAGTVPFETLNLDRGVMTTLPDGVKASGFTATQPATTYDMWERSCIRQIARCLNIPLSKALGDASGNSFSSGRLEHLNYYTGVRVERSECESAVLDKTFAAWYVEARLLGLLPANAPEVPPAHTWHWPPMESIDPIKDATAAQLRLASNTTTLAIELGEQGHDWEAVIVQRGKELALMKKLGLIVDPPPTPPAPTAAPGPAGKGRPAKRASSAAGRFDLSAGSDDQPRDENGRWAGGEHDETHDKWNAEDVARDEKHDDTLTEIHERHDDDTVDRAREKEDAKIERTRDKEDSALNKTRDKEDRKDERENDKAQLKHDLGADKEQKAIEKEREAEYKEAQARGASQEELDSIDAKHDEKEQECNDRREKADFELNEKQSQKEEEKQLRRDREDAEREARRETEHKAQEQEGERQDDAARAERDREESAAHDRHEAEQKTVYHARASQNPAAHKEYYSAAEHAEHGAPAHAH